MKMKVIPWSPLAPRNYDENSCAHVSSVVCDLLMILLCLSAVVSHYPACILANILLLCGPYSVPLQCKGLATSCPHALIYTVIHTHTVFHKGVQFVKIFIFLANSRRVIRLLLFFVFHFVLTYNFSLHISVSIRFCIALLYN